MWIKTNWDFGVPLIGFTLDVRGKLGQKFLELLKGTKDDPIEIERVATQLISLARPNMAGNFVVIGIQRNWPGAQWRFDVVSPLLPRCKTGKFKEERLETCQQCNKPLGCEPGVTLFLAKYAVPRLIGSKEVVEVCSQVCADAYQRPLL